MPRRYRVDFGSTDDPDLDAELIRIEGQPMTFDEALAVAAKYKVSVLLFEEDGEVAHAVDREGRPSTAEAIGARRIRFPSGKL